MTPKEKIAQLITEHTDDICAVVSERGGLTINQAILVMMSDHPDHIVHIYGAGLLAKYAYQIHKQVGRAFDKARYDAWPNRAPALVLYGQGESAAAAVMIIDLRTVQNGTN